MGDYRLSVTQRNELFKAAVQRGLDPASFEWREEQYGRPTAHWIHRLVHTPTGAYIQIGYVDVAPLPAYVFDYWPRTPALTWAKTWPELRSQLLLWLDAVQAEAGASDLWATARLEREWLTGGIGSNTAFTPVEREQIAHHLRTLEEYVVRTNNLLAEQGTYVREQFDYLREAADRVGRLDWKNLAASTFLNIVLTLAMDVEKAQRLLGIATQLLGPLVANVAGLIQ